MCVSVCVRACATAGQQADMIPHTLSYMYSALTVIWTAQTFLRAVSGTVWEIHLCHPVSYLMCDTSFYCFLFCGTLAMSSVDVGHHQCATNQETVESNMEASDNVAALAPQHFSFQSLFENSTLSCLLTSVLFIAMCLKRAKNVHINTDVSFTANQSFNWQTNAIPIKTKAKC